MKGMTHTQIIKEHLAKYGTITSIEAFERYGITRLAATIFVLKRAPHKLVITAEDCEGTNRYGRHVTYARYHLVKETEDGKDS